MRAISQRQFDAYCYVREPVTQLTSEEAGWFEAYDRKLLAIIIRDLTDDDYGFVLLGRDARKLFRCIEVSENFHESPEKAIADLEQEIKKYENDGKDIYPQGDEVLAPNEIYELQVPEEKVHPYFRVLTDEPRFEAARNLIKEAIYSFVDVDGNYIQQFQSVAFDARLWELYLYMYLYNTGFEIRNEYQAPDYYVSRFGYECFNEAVTVGPNPDFDVPNPKTGEEVLQLSKDYLPIKFGSALFSKLNRKKKYWELEHVRGKPFILAIHDYHIPAGDGLPGSMTWTRAGLVNYLYGFRSPIEIVDGERYVPLDETPEGARPVMEKIESHTFKGKTIPSNFFAQPNSENVSAVLFSNSATITTFNRMGKLAGLGSANVKMIRRGVKANPDLGALNPLPFAVDIDDENYEEAWSDGLVMFHNSHALHPVDPRAFPDITHIWVDPETGEYEGLFSPNEIFSSVTFSIAAANEKEGNAPKSEFALSRMLGEPGAGP